MHHNIKVLFLLVLLFVIPAHTVLAQAGKTTDDLVTKEKLAYNLTDGETKELKDALTYQQKIENTQAKKPQNHAGAAYMKKFLQQANFKLLSAFYQVNPKTHETDITHKTTLMFAAEIGNLNAVSELIKYTKNDKAWTYEYPPTDFEDGISYINRCENPTSTTRGYSALMYASSQGHTDVVNYLLDAGADATIKCQFGQFNALQLAQNAGMTETASVLEKKLEADKKSKSKPNILWPFIENNFTVVSWILAIVGLSISLWVSPETHKQAKVVMKTAVLLIIISAVKFFINYIRLG